jgi:hypothetical protein
MGFVIEDDGQRISKNAGGLRERYSVLLLI